MPLHIGIKDLLDIIIVTIIVYKTLELFEGTRTLYMIIGLSFIFVFWGISVFFNLEALNWLISVFASIGLLAIIIIFQPEIRKGLALIGKNPFMGKIGALNDTAVDELVRAMLSLRDRGLGALIVIERQIGLKDYINDAGIPLNAEISAPLLVSIFTPPSPLHDGAVIIKGNKIIAARVVLPLADPKDVDPQLGTRHRASVGISSVTDCLSIVISEERHSIRIAESGMLSAALSSEELKKKLRSVFESELNKSKAENES